MTITANLINRAGDVDIRGTEGPVSLAVIYTTQGRLGVSLYWPGPDFKQSLQASQSTALWQLETAGAEGE